jgi:hypothetical protein
VTRPATRIKERLAGVQARSPQTEQRRRIAELERALVEEDLRAEDPGERLQGVGVSERVCAGPSPASRTTRGLRGSDSGAAASSTTRRDRSCPASARDDRSRCRVNPRRARPRRGYGTPARHRAGSPTDRRRPSSPQLAASVGLLLLRRELQPLPVVIRALVIRSDDRHLQRALPAHGREPVVQRLPDLLRGVTAVELDELDVAHGLPPSWSTALYHTGAMTPTGHGHDRVVDVRPCAS